MFYMIALAGAHKRVIKQLREQLATVRLIKSWCLRLIYSISLLTCLIIIENGAPNILVSFLFPFRRVETSIFWSKSCVRLRCPYPSNPQCPNPNPPAAEAAAAAAPATTPASPTILMKVCSWHTHILTPPHMCEATDWNYRNKTEQMACSAKKTELISYVFFIIIVKTLQLGRFSGPAFINTSRLLSVLLLTICLLRSHNVEAFLNL